MPANTDAAAAGERRGARGREESVGGVAGAMMRNCKLYFMII